MSSVDGTATAELAVRPLETLIRVVRGQKVLLDADLAALYDVETRVLNQAVRRNLNRFPETYMFRLTAAEAAALRSQFVILDEDASANRRGRHSKYQPLAFTEHGVVMASAVLNSERAVQMSILVVNAFVRLREIAAQHAELAARMDTIERNQEHTVSVIEVLVNDIERLAGEVEHMRAVPEPSRRRIGF